MYLKHVLELCMNYFMCFFFLCADSVPHRPVYLLLKLLSQNVDPVCIRFAFVIDLI
jgi:hypothetical protein